MPLSESILPRGYLRTLPPRARTVVKEHRRRLLRDVGGRVLDLGGDPGHLPLYPASADVVAGDGDAGMSSLLPPFPALEN